MPEEDNKILKYNHGEKSMKHPFVIYPDLEYLLKDWTLVIIILKNHQQLKKNNKASGYSMFTHCSFDAIKNKLYCYRGKDCIKRTCNKNN